MYNIGLPCRTGQLANMSLTRGRAFPTAQKSTNHLGTYPHQSSINFAALLARIVSRPEHDRLNHFSNETAFNFFRTRRARACTNTNECEKVVPHTHTVEISACLPPSRFTPPNACLSLCLVYKRKRCAWVGRSPWVLAGRLLIMCMFVSVDVGVKCGRRRREEGEREGGGCDVSAQRSGRPRPTDRPLQRFSLPSLGSQGRRGAMLECRCRCRVGEGGGTREPGGKEGRGRRWRNHRLETIFNIK